MAKPNSFLFLHEINLSGTTFRDSDIACLQHLPRLARLWLQGTGVTNQACVVLAFHLSTLVTSSISRVFLLLPLKRCLQELDIAYNPEINDDVIVAFNMLSRLLYLKLLGTSITIAGVRRLTTYLRRRGYAMDLEVPASCEDYLRRASVLSFRLTTVRTYTSQNFTSSTFLIPDRHSSRTPKLFRI